MTIDNDFAHKLSHLIGLYANGLATDEQFAKLEYLLNSSEEVRTFYVSEMSIHQQLYWNGRELREMIQQNLEDLLDEPSRDRASDRLHDNGDSLDAMDEDSQPTASPPPSWPAYRFIEETPSNKDPVPPLVRWWQRATLCVAVLLVLVSLRLYYSPQVASLPDLTSQAIVGEVTSLSRCTWADNAQRLNCHDRVAIGRKIHLKGGLLEITYDTGAQVILQGPAIYEVTSSNGGFLVLGKLTANTDSDQAKGFAIRTPTAQVVDLSTEFGVQVDSQGATISRVFRGSVVVHVVSDRQQPAPVAQILSESQSARVDHGNRLAVFDSSARPLTFVRRMPQENSQPTVKTFDLVDVVAGGNGFSGLRDAGIDPTTGQRSDVIEFGDPTADAVFPSGDRQYHRAADMPFVDGVFVPDGSTGPVQVDSAGHRFAEFPKTNNQTAFMIRAGGAIPTVRWKIPTTLGGIDYASPGHGLLLFHPNKGLTFDLSAIRKANPGWAIRQFLAVAGNTETVSASGNDAFADVWVLVDGEVRFKRCQINSTHGALSIAIPITASDRFLTLASTDSGGPLDTDWILFGDPRLELITADDQPTSP